MRPRSLRRTVFFIPRSLFSQWPISAKWIPHGLAHGPFHPNHEDVPPDATEEYSFDSSLTLESYLDDFNRKIRPSLKIPSLDDPSKLCAIFFDQATPSRIKELEVMSAFSQRVMSEMLRWWRHLPQDLRTQVRLGSAEAGDDGALAMQLTKAHVLLNPVDDDALAMQTSVDIFSTNGKLIELKAWICIFTELNDYFLRYQTFINQLARLHDQPHDCSVLSATTDLGVITWVKKLFRPSDPLVGDKDLNHESLPVNKSLMSSGASTQRRDFSSNQSILVPRRSTGLF
ncbi:hypothetical protein B0H16DRAFT_1655518 [Mycena metata]|uniref:Uncharacterized protein n=1 Tax=Mycena metata TaxID=1033252 RepID=A0AAD7GE73_9AGAR|nr:hypothetical protein B0H16DRAFT_1655518 [Mycena metata]